jgi:hypothetical protein
MADQLRVLEGIYSVAWKATSDGHAIFIVRPIGDHADKSFEEVFVDYDPARIAVDNVQSGREARVHVRRSSDSPGTFWQLMLFARMNSGTPRIVARVLFRNDRATKPGHPPAVELLLRKRS